MLSCTDQTPASSSCHAVSATAIDGYCVAKHG
jgi:hypothetical protein